MHVCEIKGAESPWICQIKYIPGSHNPNSTVNQTMNCDMDQKSYIIRLNGDTLN